MQYFLGYLPPKEFRHFYEKLVQEISERFGLEKLSQKKRMPHLTLKSPSNLYPPQMLEKIVKEFCRTQIKSKFEIRNFGNFEEDVIFLKTTPSKEMESTFKQFLTRLENEGIYLKKYDNTDKISYMVLAKENELNGRFQEVYDYLRQKKLEFTLPFDNITIFQKSPRGTTIYGICLMWIQITLKTNFSRFYNEKKLKALEEKRANEMEVAEKTP